MASDTNSIELAAIVFGGMIPDTALMPGLCPRDSLVLLAWQKYYNMGESFTAWKSFGFCIEASSAWLAGIHIMINALYPSSRKPRIETIDSTETGKLETVYLSVMQFIFWVTASRVKIA